MTQRRRGDMLMAVDVDIPEACRSGLFFVIDDETLANEIGI